MLYFSILLSISSIIFCVLIFRKFGEFKIQHIEKYIEENYIVLPKLKERANYNDVDPDNKTILDVIKSMKIEDWQVSFKENLSAGDILYEFELFNPQKTLKVRSRMRYYSDFGAVSRTNDLRLSHFSVRTTFNDSISYEENDTNKHVSVLIRDFLWKIVCEKNQQKYDEDFEHYRIVKLSIDNELKTLRRDEFLSKIIEE